MNNQVVKIATSGGSLSGQRKPEKVKKDLLSRRYAELAFCRMMALRSRGGVSQFKREREGFYREEAARTRRAIDRLRRPREPRRVRFPEIREEVASWLRLPLSGVSTDRTLDAEEKRG